MDDTFVNCGDASFSEAQITKDILQLPAWNLPLLLIMVQLEIDPHLVKEQHVLHGKSGLLLNFDDSLKHFHAFSSGRCEKGFAELK